MQPEPNLNRSQVRDSRKKSARPVRTRIRGALPGLGLIGTGAGTAGAWFLVPKLVTQETDLRAAGLVMTLGLSVGPVAALYRDLRSVLRAENVVVLGCVFWLLLDLLQAVLPLESLAPQNIRTAFLAVGIFVTGVWLACFQRPWVLPRFVSGTGERLATNLYFYSGVIAFTLGFLRFAIPAHFDLVQMMHYLGESRWSAPWSRGQEGGWDAFLDHLSYFGYVLPMLTVVVALRTRWTSGRTITLAIFSLIIGAFLAQGGGRRSVGCILGSGFAYWILSHRAVRWRHLLVMALGLALLLSFLQLMLDYRNVGLGALFGRPTEADIERSEKFRVDDNFLRLTQITSILPAEHPYVYWRYPLWVLVRPIPRVFWPGKPVDPGFDLPSYLNAPGVSYSSSVIGELFMCAGLIGVFVGGWIYGRLACTASQILNSRPEGSPLIFYCAFVLALFAGLRSGIELVLMSYVALVWLAVSSLSEQLFPELRPGERARRRLRLRSLPQAAD